MRDNISIASKICIAKDRAEEILKNSVNFSGKSIAYVGYGIGVIKQLKEIFSNCKANASVSDEEKVSIKELIAKLIRHLSNVDLDEDDEKAQQYSQILSHYRFSELADDKSLVFEFEKARQRYRNRPNDGRICIMFG